jgi:hypothetical protein
VLADPDPDALDIDAKLERKKPHSASKSRAGGVVADKMDRFRAKLQGDANVAPAGKIH